ncbi:hypothetical protein BDV29DRAFT_164102 [Aspergillus leporis]|uniref:Uncharacterized protein n=1 Tax=Aspergillus leporis TaxID=41062 RepID=A0A5N5XFZ1_9EURO|nr:hypothetical protein BDV29DRAFT_164102 [Aspergillus leporis]
MCSTVPHQTCTAAQASYGSTQSMRLLGKPTLPMMMRLNCPCKQHMTAPLMRSATQSSIVLTSLEPWV